jgi:hypothetical protein
LLRSGVELTGAVVFSLRFVEGCLHEVVLKVKLTLHFGSKFGISRAADVFHRRVGEALDPTFAGS